MHSFKSAAAFVLAGSLVLAALPAAAATPAEIQKNFEAAARASAPGFSGFSAERGQKFFSTTHGNDWSCTSCHTATPAAPGQTREDRQGDRAHGAGGESATL